MGTFSKVVPGQPFVPSAVLHNKLAELAQAFDLDQGGEGAVDYPQNGVVKVRNDSGDDAEQYGVLGLDSPLLGPADNIGEFKKRISFRGVLPVVSDPAELTDHTGRFAILKEPIAKGTIGRAVVAGLAICRLKVNDPNDRQRFADVADGETFLQDAASGAAQILWAEDNGQEEQWAVVRIGAGPAADEDDGGGSTFELTTRHVEGYVGTAGMQQMGDNVKNFDEIGVGGSWGGTNASESWRDSGRVIPFPSTAGGIMCNGILLRQGGTATYSTLTGKTVLNATAATTEPLPANTYSNGTSGVGATLTGTSNGALVAIDGVTLTAGQLLVVKNETGRHKNGLYTLTTVGSGGAPYVLTRAATMDTSTEFFGAIVLVASGTLYTGRHLVCGAGASITVGGDAVEFYLATSGQWLRVSHGDLHFNETITETPSLPFIGTSGISTLGSVISPSVGNPTLTLYSGSEGSAVEIGKKKLRFRNYDNYGGLSFSMQGGTKATGTFSDTIWTIVAGGTATGFNLLTMTQTGGATPGTTELNASGYPGMTLTSPSAYGMYTNQEFNVGINSTLAMGSSGSITCILSGLSSSGPYVQPDVWLKAIYPTAFAASRPPGIGNRPKFIVTWGMTGDYIGSAPYGTNAGYAYLTDNHIWFGRLMDTTELSMMESSKGYGMYVYGTGTPYWGYSSSRSIGLAMAFPLTAKGQIPTIDGNFYASKISPGADGTVLVADSASASGWTAFNFIVSVNGASGAITIVGDGGITNTGTGADNTLSLGVVDVPHGGTGLTSVTAGVLVLGNGTSPLTELSGSSDGQFLVWAGSAWAAGPSPSSAGEVLFWNGSAWALSAAPSIGDVLEWNGSAWAPVPH